MVCITVTVTVESLRPQMESWARSNGVWDKEELEPELRIKGWVKVALLYLALWCVQHFMCIVSFNLHSNPFRWVPLLATFFLRGRNRLRQVSHVPTQLVDGRVKIQTQVRLILKPMLWVTIGIVPSINKNKNLACGEIGDSVWREIKSTGKGTEVQWMLSPSGTYQILVALPISQSLG